MDHATYGGFAFLPQGVIKKSGQSYPLAGGPTGGAPATGARPSSGGSLTGASAESPALD